MKSLQWVYHRNSPIDCPLHMTVACSAEIH